MSVLLFATIALPDPVSVAPNLALTNVDEEITNVNDPSAHFLPDALPIRRRLETCRSDMCNDVFSDCCDIPSNVRCHSGYAPRNVGRCGVFSEYERFECCSVVDDAAAAGVIIGLIVGIVVIVILSVVSVCWCKQAGVCCFQRPPDTPPVFTGVQMQPAQASQVVVQSAAVPAAGQPLPKFDPDTGKQNY